MPQLLWNRQGHMPQLLWNRQGTCHNHYGIDMTHATIIME